MIYSDLEREFNEKQANVQLLEKEIVENRKRCAELEKEIDQVNKEIGEVQYGHLIDLCESTHKHFQMVITKVLGRNMDSIVVQRETTVQSCLHYMKEHRYEGVGVGC
ncbi:unnamed protein product, partial [Rotaria sp. Silwood1]